MKVTTDDSMEVIAENKKMVNVDFNNTQIAFAQRSDKELNTSYLLFRLMSKPSLVKMLSKMAKTALALGLPVKKAIKATVFNQFCGGETENEIASVISRLGEAGIGTILDYSEERNHREEAFEKAKSHLLKNIELAKDNPSIPVTCIKVTSIASFELLEKVTTSEVLTDNEHADIGIARARLYEICQASARIGKPIYVDAEESWIQGAIDDYALEFMQEFNTERAMVYTTLQMYRWDRYDYLKELLAKAKAGNFKLGIKLVRGAYLEKENTRARNFGYRTPINHSKPATDKEYNKAMKLIVDNIDHIELCAGTHNAESCKHLIDLMHNRNLSTNHPHISFSQLYGMSDHLTYNLAKAGYNVTKYLPYGPVESTIPYLVRRAEENTAIAGQMGGELKMIIAERKRRRGQ